MPAILEMPTVAPRTVHQPAKTVLTGKELLILELERIQYEKMMGEVSVVDYNQCCFYSPYDQPEAMTIECWEQLPLKPHLALRVFHIIHSHLFDNVTQFR